VPRWSGTLRACFGPAKAISVLIHGAVMPECFYRASRLTLALDVDKVSGFPPKARGNDECYMA